MLCGIAWAAVALWPAQPLTARSRAGTASACACSSAPRTALAEALEFIPNRGLEQHADSYRPPEYVAEVLRMVAALEATSWPANQAEDWMIADCLFASSWRLAYTSSRTFARYGGLSSWAGRFEGVSTPSLVMHITRSPQLVVLEEALTDEASAMALARALNLPAAERPTAPSVLVEGVWRTLAGDGLGIDTKAIRYGSRSFKPADGAADGMIDFEHEKAVRVLGATKPVFLDASLLVLRGQAEGVVFIFDRPVPI